MNAEIQNNLEVSKQTILSGFLVWFCLTTFYCYQYILRILPNIIMPNLIEKFSITNQDFGSFAGIYYIGYILAHIPVGILLGRFGGKTVLTLSVIVTTLGLIPLVYSDSWYFVVVGRFMTGAASSAAIVGALHIFRTRYPENFAITLGLMVSVSLITMVYASEPMAYLIDSFGIKTVVDGLLYLGLGLAALTFILMPKIQNSEKSYDLKDDLKEVLLNPRLIFASLCSGLMVGPIEGFADAWGSAFMINVYAITKEEADPIVFASFLGMCFGSIVIPFVADKVKSDYGVTIFCALIMIICFGYILGGSVPIQYLYSICFVIGIFSSYQVLMISKATTYVSLKKSGTAAAVINMIAMSFGTFFHNAIGFSVDFYSTKIVSSSDVMMHSKNSYIFGISVIPIAMIFAVVGVFILIKIDKRKKYQDLQLSYGS